MKTLKFYLIILLTISVVIPQEKSFDQSIKDTENQIKQLKNSINAGNNEVKKLSRSQRKQKKY
jgi:cell division protein FtsL